jgi:RNA polymerase sigma-70 factor (ECF subfamily)
MTTPERTLVATSAPTSENDGQTRSSRHWGGADAPSVRLRGIIDGYYDFVWRTLRFHGVSDAAAEDGAQQVFCVVAHRLKDIAPGAELSFLYSTALRVASEARRSLRRRPAAGDHDVDTLEAPLPSPDHLLDQHRARALLEEILDAMPADLRAVFVLFEIEELTVPAIAALLELPAGTAASRLRRAREEFQSILKRKQAARSRGVRP